MSNLTPTRERWPAVGSGWTGINGARLPRMANCLSWSAWTNGKLNAISELCIADHPDGDGSGLHFHISFTAKGKHADTRPVLRALKAFGLSEAREDNHEPGAARNFWLPVDPAHRVDCECKTTEQQMVERNGHAWSAAHDVSKCGGCLLQSIGGPICPAHGDREARP